MDFKRLSSRAKDLVDKRGGTESLKQDAEQLREIAKGSGSLGDKAKAAVGAIKDPGGDERHRRRRPRRPPSPRSRGPRRRSRASIAASTPAAATDAAATDAAARAVAGASEPGRGGQDAV